MPKVSVLIPTYLRPDDLVFALSRTLEQDFHDFEIVVIDDGTPGDAIKDAVARFPTVRYIRLERNVGLIAARNIGETHCRGDYIVNLDDDCWLMQNDAISRIVAFMDTRPEVAIASLTLIQPGRAPNHDVNSLPAPVRTYSGGANVARRTVIEATGGYIEEFYRQGEEIERSLRIMDQGYQVFSFPQVSVYHNHSEVNRNMARHLSFEGANLLRRELIRAPLLAMPLSFLRVARFLVRFRARMDMPHFIEEVFGKRVPLWSFVRRRRKPVSMKTYIGYLKLN